MAVRIVRASLRDVLVLRRGQGATELEWEGARGTSYFRSSLGVVPAPSAPRPEHSCFPGSRRRQRHTLRRRREARREQPGLEQRRGDLLSRLPLLKRWKPRIRWAGGDKVLAGGDSTARAGVTRTLWSLNTVGNSGSQASLHLGCGHPEGRRGPSGGLARCAPELTAWSCRVLARAHRLGRSRLAGLNERNVAPGPGMLRA
jgi:hypothetical protein